MIRMGSEAEALDLWCKEIAPGGRAEPLGTQSAVEVSTLFNMSDAERTHE